MMCCMRQGSAVLCREIGDKASSSGHHLFGNSKQPAVSSAAVTVVTCLLLLSGTLGHTAALACMVAQPGSNLLTVVPKAGAKCSTC